MTERIGLLGGAFDPIHLGHLILASEARWQLELTRLLFVPTYASAHQNKAIVTSFEDRCAMVKAAIDGQPQFELSRIEEGITGKSYTVKTLETLKEMYPQSSLYFLMGGDSLGQMDSWYEPERLQELATVVVAKRAGYQPRAKPPGTIRCIDMPQIEISATEIRRRVRARLPISFLVPPAVAAYIERTGLYRN